MTRGEKDAPLHEGGCLCGGVRFRARGESSSVVLCHCESCRRGAGAPAVAWATFPLEAVELSGETLASIESSPGIHRSFCSRCGSSIGYLSHPDEIDLTVATFDDPERLPYTRHVWTRHRLSWFDTRDDNPRFAELSSMETEIPPE